MNAQGRAGMKMARIAFWNFALGNNTKLSNLAKAALDEAEKEITALREALNTRSSSTHSDAEYSEVAQPQDHSEQHLNMVQGEWVDLTDDEIKSALTNWFSEPMYWAVQDAKSAIAKFKEKNTPPVMPQGEPVALNIVRKWPDGFQERLQNVWLDVVSFTPNVKLYDLQKVLAEFDLTMIVYEGDNAPAVVPQGEPFAWVNRDELLLAFEKVSCGTAYKNGGEGRMPVYTTPPSAAQAARQMRDAAVNVCRDEEDGGYFADRIAALPIIGEQK